MYDYLLGDIVCNIIMDESRSDELENALRLLDERDEKLDALKRRAGNFRPRELQRAAEGLGYIHRSQRTGEPVWEHPKGHTVAIPEHPKDVGKGLAIKIIKTLQGAIALIRSDLQQELDRINNRQSQRRY